MRGWVFVIAPSCGAVPCPRGGHRTSVNATRKGGPGEEPAGAARSGASSTPTARRAERRCCYRQHVNAGVLFVPSGNGARVGEEDMDKKLIKTMWAAGFALGTLVAVGTVAPAAAAPPRYPVDIVDHVEFDAASSMFESNIPGCESGWDIGGESSTHFTPWGGVFTGMKEFTCDGGEGGFTLRLNARFDENGSTGSWTFVDGWGSLEGVKGSGMLVGTNT